MRLREKRSFAFIGPAILMFAFGYGITFDVENLKRAKSPGKPPM